MVDTLNKLSAQETRLYEIAEGLEGSMKIKQQILEESGVFSEYIVLHRKYLEFFEETDSASLKLEALKRMVFLNWYLHTEPSIYTGLNELDEAAIVASFQQLNTYVAENRLDEEFTWMLSYYSCWENTILEYSEPHLAALTDFVKRVDTSILHAPIHQLPKGIMDNRGQMGHYWRSCSVELNDN